MDRESLAPGGEWTGLRLVSVRAILVLLVMCLAGAGGAYYYFWKEARVEAWRKGEDAAPYRTLREAFLVEVRAGRHEQAYAMTSKRYQRDVGLKRFAELARRYVELDQQPSEKYLGEGVGQSGPATGDYGGIENQRVEYQREFRYKEGLLVTITLVVGREEDSLWRMTPPEFKVVEFRIEEGREKGER